MTAVATEKNFMEYICDQAGPDFGLSYRLMFGEYVIYLDGKVIALVCDNQLFLKPTVPGREILGTVNEQPPYTGAKPCFLLADELENPDLLRRVMGATAAALPLPRPKKPRKKS